MGKSQCDQFAVEHFCFSTGGYIFEGDIEAFYQQLGAGHYEQLQDIEKRQNVEEGQNIEEGINM